MISEVAGGKFAFTGFLKAPNFSRQQLEIPVRLGVANLESNGCDLCHLKSPKAGGNHGFPTDTNSDPFCTNLPPSGQVAEVDKSK